MSNNRNGFTSLAYITVLGLALAMFLFVEDGILQFRIICVTCLSLGTFTSIFYLININELHLEKVAKEKDKEYRLMKKRLKKVGNDYQG